ncbi:diguanylate cyclase (GGDEF)-like protein [Erwinia toletana]|uniref:diguanylate cyclase n=1 Tax=Winslowiella toletana TaxID=92490 RepID=A0ABS4PF41_9GAMM|nr:GGDEF domain-containing protein [Winslowiella toletana]MBP2171273.1 diguanylate cyclase (GGDEF)-like protein [Winslowiella toletana]
MRFSNRLSASLLLNSSLGRSITVFVCLLFVAVVIINLWSLKESWQRTVGDAEQTAVNLSLSQARQAEDTVLQTEITLRDIQRDIQAGNLTSLDASALSNTMRELRSRLPQLHGLFYFNASGKWVARSVDREPVGANNADREYIHFHRNNRHTGIHIGPVIRSRSTGDLVIPVSLRMNDAAGAFAGVLLATIRVDYFRQYYSYYEMGSKDVLVLMLADSSVLYARPMPDSYIGMSLAESPLFRQMLIKSDRGSGEWSSVLDGQPRIFGFARSQRYPLVVAAGYDRATLIDQWLKERLQDMALNAALLISILFMGGSVLRQVRTNIKNQSELAHLRDELTSVNHALQALALVDGLTGVANRRQFDTVLEQSLQRSASNGQPVSLIMMDIDYFKRYNDTYGHVAGDNCLKRVGEILRAMPHRQADLIARYGGEEFAIVLHDTTLQEARVIAQRAVDVVRETAISHQSSDRPEHVVTLSAGCFTLTASGNPGDVRRIKEGADRALYAAKRNGRNRVSALSTPWLPVIND